MRNNRSEESVIGIGCLVIIALCVIAVAVFVWEYNSIAPWLPGIHNSWFDGLVHGAYGPMNFIVNSIIGQPQQPLYANSGSWWYSFGYLIGIGAFFGPPISISRRRSSNY